MKLEKVTDTPEPPLGRRYDDACGAAHALDLLGERWALLVVRELIFGPKRFSDLRADLPGISANVLTQRLEGLESAGIVERRRLPPPAASQVYELTSWGYESEPIFQALGRWAARSPLHDPALPISTVSFLMSLRTMFDPVRAGDLVARIGFRLGAETFVAHVAGGQLDVARAEVAGADVVFTGPAGALAAGFYSGQPLAALQEGGVLSIEGDQALAQRFARLFPLPPKVGQTRLTTRRALAEERLRLASGGLDRARHRRRRH